MIEAIVFDFDGLILDTETNMYHALQHIFHEHGADLPIEVWGDCIGTHNHFDPYSYLEDCVGKPLDHDKLHQLRTEKFNDLMGQEKPLPGVENYLSAAADLNLKIGLASSSDRKWVTGFLSDLGLLHYFECIRTSDDVEKVKPDPTLYLEVLNCLDVRPINAIAFEDSPNGALAAKRAGMRCVVVPNPITSQLVFGEFDRKVSSLLEIELTQLVKEF